MQGRLKQLPLGAEMEQSGKQSSLPPQFILPVNNASVYIIAKTKSFSRGLCLNFVQMKNAKPQEQPVKKVNQCTNELLKISDDWYCKVKEDCIVTFYLTLYARSMDKT